MTDLPFGRGGSPFQNLIARGIYDTKIIAKSWTWEWKRDDTFFPTTFFKFYLDKKLIAKMYMLYQDLEMEETEFGLKVMNSGIEKRKVQKV